MPQTARQKQLLAGGIMVFIRTSPFAAGQYHEATGQFSFPQATSDSFTMNKAALKDFCGDTKRANITVRNFPLTVDALRKKLHVKEGGDVYWFATTLCDGQKVIIACEKLPASHRPD